MGSNFGVAVLLLFLLMAALFRSVKDSLLVVMAMPLAMVGGVVALRLLNLVTFQPLDLLTMIGFVILLGLVVNNAILLVHQTRSAEATGEQPYRCGAPGPADPHAADLHEHPDQHLRHAAAAADARHRQRDLPWPGRGHRRRHVLQHRIHPVPAALPAAHGPRKNVAVQATTPRTDPN